MEYATIMRTALDVCGRDSSPLKLKWKLQSFAIIVETSSSSVWIYLFVWFPYKMTFLFFLFISYIDRCVENFMSVITHPIVGLISRVWFLQAHLRLSIIQGQSKQIPDRYQTGVSWRIPIWDCNFPNCFLKELHLVYAPRVTASLGSASATYFIL